MSSAQNNECEEKACLCDLELIKSLISKMDMFDPDFSSNFPFNFSPSANCMAPADVGCDNTLLY